ncbi:MAG: methionyl-tRNA formyltransferase [Acidobacteria bacterium]|nr:methionyl-tRNA formyltransferase [Acidobacteriota bacterium]
MSRPLRIVYFGTPAFAVPSLERLIGSPHDVVSVVSQPDRPKGRGQRLIPTATSEVAARSGIPVLQPERIRDLGFSDLIAALQPDLGVVAAYGKILPDALLGVPRYGMINVHASILPAYRGAAPVQRAVIAGERETGVTIMRVVRELDAGPTFAIARRAIGPDETSEDVERGLAELGAGLLLDVVTAMAEGRAVETPQDDAKATYAPKIVRAESTVDWSLPAARLHDLVRGLQPWPLVAVSIDGARHLIHQTARTDRQTDAPGGTVIDAAGEHFEVAAGDRRVLRIVRIQPEGRRVMTAREFLAGHQVAVGARFGPP